MDGPVVQHTKYVVVYVYENFLRHARNFQLNQGGRTMVEVIEWFQVWGTSNTRRKNHSVLADF